MLADNPFLAGLTRLVDRGRLAGNADLTALRVINPGLLSFRAWLAGSGKQAFVEALDAGGHVELRPLVRTGSPSAMTLSGETAGKRTGG
jgi:hypothetical protein